MSQKKPKTTVPPIPMGLEDLVSMAAASPEFAAALAGRRAEAVEASGVTLAPTEAAVLEAVDDATLERMIESCRVRQASETRRLFLTRASAALVLLVGAGAVAGCEKKSKGDVRTPGVPPHPQMRPARQAAPDASAPDASTPDASVARERMPPQVTAGVRPPRPRPRRPSGVKTGISPEHRRPKRLDVDTGNRPD